MFNKIKENWDSILKNLCTDQELSPVSFKTWLKPLVPVSLEGDELRVVFPGEQFGIDYILKRNYDFFLGVQIQEATGIDCKVVFVLPGDVNKPVAAPVAKKKPVQNSSIGLNPKYTFDTYVVGNNNQMAHAASLAVAEAPGESFNPLFIYGGVGLGKTHLMHSIGNYILSRNPETKILYTTTEDFTNNLIDSILDKNKNNNKLAAFREKYRNNDVLMIDDIQFIMNKDSTQEEFFHTFNALYQSKKQIIISSDRPPADMELLEDRLKSRFQGGLTVDISLPDYETRMAILRSKADQEGYKIDDEVINYIAVHVQSNIRELEGALTKVVAFSKLQNTPITLAMTENILKDQISETEVREITPELIIQIVSEHCHISLADMISAKRNKEIARPRQIAMYLCKEMTDVPYIKIGSCLGNRDHATIIYGCEKVKEDLTKDEALKTTIDTLKKKINPLF